LQTQFNLVQMRKFVLAIIGVGVVQAAFVNIMFLQAPVDLAIGPVQTELRTPPAPYPAPLPDENARIEPKAETAASRETAPRSVAMSTAAKVIEQTAKRSAPKTISASEPGPETSNTDFTTVVISYNGRTDAPECDAPETPAPKKRSLLAKAAPVVKTPWKWIKTIGSKLN
jgi:hypothetical protein